MYQCWGFKVHNLNFCKTAAPSSRNEFPSALRSYGTSYCLAGSVHNGLVPRIYTSSFTTPERICFPDRIFFLFFLSLTTALFSVNDRSLSNHRENWNGEENTKSWQQRLVRLFLKLGDVVHINSIRRVLAKTFQLDIIPKIVRKVRKKTVYSLCQGFLKFFNLSFLLLSDSPVFSLE